MTDLYLVRHGHTPWECTARVKGQLDVPLSPLGLRQAAKLAAYFRGIAVDAICSSPLGRARRTAAPISEVMGVAATSQPLITERGFGLWQGLTSKEVARERRLGWEQTAPLGESLQAMAQRVGLFLDLVSHGWRGARVVAVTHEGVIKTAVLPAIGLPVTQRSAFSAALGSVSLLRHDGREWRPVFLNVDPVPGAQTAQYTRVRAQGG